MGYSFIHIDVSMEISPRQFHLEKIGHTQKVASPKGNSHLPIGKMGSIGETILGRIKKICNGKRLTFLVSSALEAELLVPFTDKRAKRDKHNVGQKMQKKAKKGSDILTL